MGPMVLGQCRSQPIPPPPTPRVCRLAAPSASPVPARCGRAGGSGATPRPCRCRAPGPATSGALSEQTSLRRAERSPSLSMTKHTPSYFKTSPEIIRLAVMIYVRFPLSLRNVEDLLHERGIDISHETVRFWWNRFGPMFAAEIRRKRASGCAPIQTGSGTWTRFS